MKLAASQPASQMNGPDFCPLCGIPYENHNMIGLETCAREKSRHDTERQRQVREALRREMLIQELQRR